MSISLCMICRNESEHLPAALASVKGLSDEIIIVDTGSTDGTIDIAKQHGTVVLSLPWNGDFSAARNESIRMASKEWILFIDADEVIAASDHSKIRELCAHPTMMGWILDQRNYTDDHTYYGWQPCDTYKECRASGFFVSPITRLFRNDKRISFVNKVHEEVDTAITSIGGEIAYAHIPVHHYGYLKGEATLAQKRDTYLALAFEDIKARPEHAKGYYEVGKIYKSMGKHEEALKMLAKAASIDPLYKLVYTNIGDVYAKIGEDDHAIAAYDKSIQLKPTLEHAQINKGIIFVKKGAYDQGARCFAAALAINPRSAAGHTNLVASLTKLGDVQATFLAAKRAFRETQMPKFKAVLSAMHKKYPTQLHVAELLIDKKYGAAEMFLRDIIHRKPDDIWALSNLAKVLEKEGKRDEAHQIVMEALQYESPQQKELENYLGTLQ
ncbi:glycosyltransferase [Candidatus Woesearchaeota archaeon]|nr:glycosyltransferase [Candidatus Woesearchaeota archaeon]